MGDIDRKKREPDRPAGVADQDPAVDKLASQARRDCSGLVIWLISGSIRSPTQEVCQAAASGCSTFRITSVPTYSRPSAGYPDDREISQHLGFTSMALLSSARASA